MTLHRLSIHPRSPWRTPWHADTLTGALLSVCAATLGPDILRNRLIKPMLAGAPPFVLSDAFPGDLLPMPVHLRLAEWPDTLDRKHLKRARFLPFATFDAARSGLVPPLEQLRQPQDAYLESVRQHNTLGRLTDTTGSGDEGLAPYQRPETALKNPREHLTLYLRLLDHSAADLLSDLFHALSLTGFGADTSTGRGQFDLLDDPTPVPHLDEPSPHANAVISLSTFQPAPLDPADGYWETHLKFGKLGPELAALAGEHRKNTLVMFRPGAVFHATPDLIRRGFLGHAIPADQLLPLPCAQQLAQHNIHPIQPAFALTLPILLPQHPS
jgi:CRISPR-associated protein Csm4